MVIHGLNKLTLLDYPHHTACTVFVGGCNFRCPFCHNASLVLRPNTQPVIKEEEFFEYLDKRKGLIEGVCITGGEPTLYSELPEFIKKIKPVVFSPDDINIVNGNSMNRRRFMDFFISLLEPNYLSALQCYSIALKSRNIILKNQLVDVDMLKAYEVILAEFGTIISNFRKKYSQILTDSIKKLLLNFYGSATEFKIKYHPLAPCFDEESFMERFQQERERDLKRGFSSFGPQVDEFDFFLDQKMMRNFASNGQCRLISLCLKMASVEIISQNNDKNDIVVLVDDVTGDLDPVVKETFFKTIDCAGQSFFTFTEIPDEKYFDNRMVYKINDGVIG